MNLVGGLEHFLFFHIIIGNNHPNRLSYLLAELKPPTSEPFNTRERSLESTEVKRYVPHSGHPELKLCGALVFFTPARAIRSTGPKFGHQNRQNHGLNLQNPNSLLKIKILSVYPCF
jgi:hypothetical protein